MFFTWHKITDPSTGWLASKTSGWTADSFSGGLEVDFSSVVPAGTKAVRCFVNRVTGNGTLYWRKSDDSNILNTPNASTEYSHRFLRQGDYDAVVVLWLSSDYKVQIATTDTGDDLYIAYPVEYLS